MTDRIDYLLAQVDDLQITLDRYTLYSVDQRDAFDQGVNAALAAVKHMLQQEKEASHSGKAA